MDKLIYVSLLWLFFKRFLCMWCGIHVCDLDFINLLTLKVEFIILIGSDLDTIDPITVGNKFIIIFDGNNSNSDKLNKFEYNYATNSSHITIMTHNFCTISGAAICNCICDRYCVLYNTSN